MYARTSVCIDRVPLRAHCTYDMVASEASAHGNVQLTRQQTNQTETKEVSMSGSLHFLHVIKVMVGK